MVHVETLIKGLKEMEIEVSPQQIEKFVLYKELLKKWNEKINITAITDDEETDIKHFLDSIALLKLGLISENSKVIDVGTGGGFPGLPLKIMKEDINVVLLDSLNKRIKFLEEVIEKTGVRHTACIHGRAEDFGRNSEYRESFDIAVSRAVASLNVLSEYCLPFVKEGGYFIAMKGPEVQGEIEEAKDALKKLGGKVEQRIDIPLPFTDITHNVIVIKKISKTPTKYPRKAGKPTKNPL